MRRRRIPSVVATLGAAEAWESEQKRMFSVTDPRGGGGLGVRAEEDVLGDIDRGF
jgi:hypothetical protein